LINTLKKNYKQIVFIYREYKRYSNPYPINTYVSESKTTKVRKPINKLSLVSTLPNHKLSPRDQFYMINTFGASVQFTSQILKYLKGDSPDDSLFASSLCNLMG
jgi:hypothetical protein